ncbi:hypothetical protein CF326_g8887, partial [Tilletia indica]
MPVRASRLSTSNSTVTSTDAPMALPSDHPPVPTRPPASDLMEEDDLNSSPVEPYSQGEAHLSLADDLLGLNSQPFLPADYPPHRSSAPLVEPLQPPSSTASAATPQAHTSASREPTPTPIPTPSSLSAPATTTPAPTASPNGIAGHRLLRTSIPGHPELTWSQVEALASPPAGSPPQGALRYQLPSWFDSSHTGHVFAYRSALLTEFHRHLSTIVSSPAWHLDFASGTGRTVDARFSHSQLLLTASTLVIPVPACGPNEPAFTLHQPIAGAALGPRYIPFTVHLPKCGPDSALRYLSNFLDPPHPNNNRDPRPPPCPAYIIDAWAKYHHCAGTQDYEYDIVALLFYPPPSFADLATPLTDEELLLLPAFLGSVISGGYVTFFPSRPAWCRSCKAAAQRRDPPDFHVNNE